ncbi:MAG: universal stress protein [Gammaproteobacteria bacterium]|nr:universal stress protein [Gammaproteobacteria bacterium]
MKTVLLASHGTEGARAAELMAFKICEKGTRLHHLTIVPTLWQGMTGDDWLQNGSTRDTYRRYLESELGKEIDAHCDKLSVEANAHELTYTREIRVGEPEECLLEASREDRFDLVIMGSPRPKGVPGLRCRMNTKPLTKSLNIPLLIVPFPHEQQ